jgi:hypothetical protein
MWSKLYELPGERGNHKTWLSPEVTQRYLAFQLDGQVSRALITFQGERSFSIGAHNFLARLRIIHSIIHSTEYIALIYCLDRPLEHGSLGRWLRGTVLAQMLRTVDKALVDLRRFCFIRNAGFSLRENCISRPRLAADRARSGLARLC